ncbi:MAG TPA: SWIM zinc finger family protein [Ktedonosporobacter sp.]|nr:SWIM zinc finger family protein [Ktedonosporobacter sp.]
MEIQLTADQILTMAPDASSATAGKKLGTSKPWKNVGQNPEVLWGECQGSALYQVRVDLTTLAIHCTCPSRKQPCKHGLGLLLLAVNNPSSVPASEEPPDWIVSWLNKRAAASKRKETKEAEEALTSQPNVASPGGTSTQRKSAGKRLAQVTQGIERLNLWLNDLARNGLGSLETQPAKFWEDQAKQMVDAQAPGLASRLRRMAAIPNASADWPAKLLAQLGQLALLTQAFHRLDQLEPALQEDVRLMIGWNLREDEVITRGEQVTDEWLTIGQVVDEVERGRTQRVWLLGTATQRPALIIQFAPPGGSFPEAFTAGVRQKARLVYWPSASPQRALIGHRLGSVTSVQEHLPGPTSIEAFLHQAATEMARLPWRERFLCTLQDVTPVYESESRRWYVRDSHGQALPLVSGEHWRLLALSGGLPIDFAGEWNGETLLPLGALTEGTYHIV